MQVSTFKSVRETKPSCSLWKWGKMDFSSSLRKHFCHLEKGVGLSYWHGLLLREILISALCFRGCHYWWQLLSLYNSEVEKIRVSQVSLPCFRESTDCFFVVVAARYCLEVTPSLTRKSPYQSGCSVSYWILFPEYFQEFDTSSEYDRPCFRSCSGTPHTGALSYLEISLIVTA